MALIGMREVSWGIGGLPLLEEITFRIEKGQRICLLGRNGVGKSTLMRLLAEEMLPDSGEVWRGRGVTVAGLDQGVSAEFDGTLFDVVADGLGQNGRRLAEQKRLLKASGTLSPTGRKRLDTLQQQLEAGEGWRLLQQVESGLSRAGLDPELPFGDLSAGMKRRALFVRAVVCDPDVLLLDEPTNHLDIDSIAWMEAFIERHVKTVLFVTHDRAFLNKIANHILELDRGRLVAYDCDYATHLNRKQAAAEVEEKQQQNFQKKLSREEVWIRQGIQARRTRNEGRVRALKQMRREHAAQRQKIGRAKLRIQNTKRSGKLVIEATGISAGYAGKLLVDRFSTVIMRGDKVGIIGPNGIGKTTLVKLLLKEHAPQAGSVRHGTHLEVAYFDQLRNRLDEQQSVWHNIGEGNDFIMFEGQKRHVISYLQDFLFAPERCRTPVHILSGGEKNRLLLAKLFTRPANVLVMDEPTNDLDVETLELLEELLFKFEQTLLLVSHDRAFLNRVVTSVIAFEGGGRVQEYAGGYDDWLRQRRALEPAGPALKVPAPKQPRAPNPAKPQKLGYRAKQELEALPEKIDALEAEQQTLYETMSDPHFYQAGKADIATAKDRLEAVGRAIENAYRRWEELEQKT